ncbi:MAG TPA: ABC transporter substrate-binding protein, partial [Bdellovibrionota bacterium]|nr:ABC transporter substrate-binding protein [Bdellovibrionota bacterium]
ASARFNLFKNGKIDLVTLAGPAELARAQADKLRIQSFTPGEVTFIRYNHRAGRPTANMHLRKAITAAVDTRELAQKVIAIPGTKPGRGLVPESIQGAKKSFRKEYPLPELKLDPALAKKELELAKKELGAPIPPLVILASDAARQGREAEYLQAQLKKHLGLESRIERQIFKIVLAKQFAGEFDLTLSSWFGDFQDPLAYLTILYSSDKNNRGKWRCDVFDRLIEQAQTTTETKKRMDAMARAEKLAIEEAAVLPKSESVEVYVQNPMIQGLIRRGMGPDPDFVYASVAR